MSDKTRFWILLALFVLSVAVLLFANASVSNIGFK
jgi:hypothetical protein